MNFKMKNIIKISIIFFQIFIFNNLFSQSGNISISILGDSTKSGKIPYLIERGFIYTPLKSFLDFFNASYSEDKNIKKLKFKLEGSSFEITEDNPFVILGEDVYQLPVGSKNFYDEIYMPVEYLCKHLTRHLPGDYLFNAEEMKINVDVGKAKLYNLRIYEKKNGTQITINSTRYFGSELSGWKTNTGYVIVTAYPAKVDSASFTIPHKIGLVRNVVANNFSQSVQLNFDLVTKNIEEPKIIQDENTYEINIFLYKKNVNVNNLIQSSDIIDNEKKNWIIDKVIIDPGHGGIDPGAVGPTGLKEKDVVLDVALKLGEMIEKNLGLEVDYTRESDVFVPIRDRTKFSNAQNGKLFLSIHCNSTNDRRVAGYEVYFLSPAREEDAREVMELENSVIELEESQEIYKDMTDENLMIYSITQSGFLKESQEFAISLSQQLQRYIKQSNNRGVKQAGFYVLIGASMPNVLIELPFISNRKNEKLYKTNEYRKELAYGIYRGIEHFVNNFRK